MKFGLVVAVFVIILSEIIMPGPCSGENPVDRFVSDIVKQIDRHSPNRFGHVLEYSDEGIITDFGYLHGAYRGLVYEVYRPNGDLQDPDDGKSIGFVPTYLGDIRLMKIFGSSSVAFPITSFHSEPKSKDIVLKKETVTRIGLYPINDLTGQNEGFSRILQEIIQYKLIQTGYFEIASEQTIARLPADPFDVKELLLSGSWHNLDEVVYLSLTESADFMTLFGHIFSFPKEQTIGFLLASMKQNEALGKLTKITRSLDSNNQLGASKTTYELAYPVLDINTLETESGTELIVLTRKTIIFFKMQPTLQEHRHIELPVSSLRGLLDRGIQGKIAVLKNIKQDRVHIFVRTSDMETGLIYQIQAKNVTEAGTFFGFPIGLFDTGLEKAVILVDYDTERGLFRSPIDIVTLDRDYSNDKIILKQLLEFRNERYFREYVGQLSNHSESFDFFILTPDYRIEPITAITEKKSPIMPTSRFGSARILLTRNDPQAISVVATSTFKPENGDQLALFSRGSDNHWEKVWMYSDFSNSITSLCLTDTNQDHRFVILVVENNGSSSLLTIFNKLW